MFRQPKYTGYGYTLFETGKCHAILISFSFYSFKTKKEKEKERQMHLKRFYGNIANKRDL